MYVCEWIPLSLYISPLAAFKLNINPSSSEGKTEAALKQKVCI